MSIFSNAYTTEQKVQAVFIGLLGRNAKTSGLDHYVAAIDNTTNNYGIAEMLSELVNTQPEYQNAVAGMGRAQVVEYVFINLFGRQPTFDASGNNYWVNGAGSAVPVDLLVTAIIDGASAQDQLALEKKVSVAIYLEQNPGLTNAEAKAILATVTASSNVADAKAAVDAALDPTGNTYVLTAGQDILTGSAKNDTFQATQATLQNGDNLNGGAGDDTLNIAVGGNSDFFAAPTISNIETIRVNSPNNSGIWIELDLSNADGYSTLESYQVTSYNGWGGYVGFYDIQNVNGTNIRIIDTNVDHEYTYDTNAYLSLNGAGGNDDIIDLYLQEVNGSVVAFGNDAPYAYGQSHADRINITSDSRSQVNTTTSNYLSDLVVGNFLNEVYISGNADFEVGDYLDWNVSLVDARGLNADLELDLYAQRLVWNINNTVNANATTVLTVYGAQQDDTLFVGGGEDGISYIDLGTGNDYLKLGEIYGEDAHMLGHSTVIAGDGNDYVEMNITGLQNVSLGAGNDSLYLRGDVDNLTTPAANDGVSTIDSGAGKDYVFVGGYGEDSYSTGDYLVDLGAGNDTLTMWVDGNPTINAGDGNDLATINVLSDVTFNGGAGNDSLTINGDGVHTIDMGSGDDWTLINGARLGSGNVDNTINDRMTTYDGGTGNDYLRVEGDHFLNATLGAGNDTISLEAKHLTADDVIRGDAVGVFNNGDDTMILTNGDYDRVVVGDSETSSVVGFETFDLRNANIRLNLTTQMFDTATGNDIVVSTRNAEGVSLPVLTINGVPAANQLSQGMSRTEYNTIKANFQAGVYDQGPYDFEDFLLDSNVNLIDFLDADLTSDGDQISSYGEDPVASTNPNNDRVHFWLEPEGDMTVDITKVPLTLLTDRQFTLLGGNIKDIVIANDASINGRSILNFDDIGSNNSVEDTLIVEGAADITAADLRNVSGLENIILKASAPAVWHIELNDRVINQTTGSATLVIRVDPNVPAGSRLNITLDPSITAAHNDVVIETTSNVEVYINGNLVTESDMINGTDYNGGLNMITVQEQLVFTTNADSLIGSGNFYAQSVNVFQEADSAEGTGEDDTLYVGFAPSNATQDLEDQFNDALITGIEHVVFTTSDYTSPTGNNVQMERLSVGEDFLDNLQSLTTGIGDDFLNNMEGENYYGGVIQYYLNAGNDYFNGEDSDHYWVDAGAGNDTVILGENADDSTVYGGAGDDYIVTGEGNDYIEGGSGNDYIYAGSGNDYILGGSGNDTIYGASGNDYIDGGSGNDYLYGEDGNDTIYGGSGDDYIYGEDGNDSLYGGTGNDTIYGGSGNDYIEGNDGDDYLYGEDGADTIYGGNGNDYIDAGWGTAAELISGGAGNDTILMEYLSRLDTVDGGTGTDHLIIDRGPGVHPYATPNNFLGQAVPAFGLTDQDFVNVSGIEILTVDGYYGGNNIWLDAGAEFQAAGILTVHSGGGDDVLDFSDITSTRNLTINANNGDDTVRGGNGADTINAGSGADSVYSSTGADRIDLGVDSDTDSVIYTESFHGALTGVGTGADLITNFNTADDMLEIMGNLFAAIDADASTTIDLAANNNNVDASVAELVVDTSQAVTDADLTTNGFANLLAHLNNGLQIANAGDNLLYLVQGQNNTALYFYQEDTGNGNIEANEIRLIGVFENALLDATNVGNLT